MNYYLIGAIVLALLLVLYFISVFNKLKKSAVQVDEAFSAIDTYLEERFDMLTKLISTAKEETRQEIEMITKVTELRSNFQKAKNVDEKVEAGMQIEAEMPKLLLTLENYPDPRFNDAFRQVQRSILVIEDKISAARRNYNSRVARYNKEIVTFPDFIAAKILGIELKKMFEATEHKRDDVDIDHLWSK